MFETRNGSSQTTFQYVWGTQYVDELVMIDKNGDPTESNDCDPDEQSGESTADERYFVHQDRNWNVVALTDYDPSGSDEGNVVERYHYTPYGQFIVLSGDSGSGEMGNVLPSSTVGNAFAYRGLPLDQDKGGYQARSGEYTAVLQRSSHDARRGWANGESGSDSGERNAMQPVPCEWLFAHGARNESRCSVSNNACGGTLEQGSSAWAGGLKIEKKKPWHTPAGQPCPLGWRDCGSSHCLCAIGQICCTGTIPGSNACCGVLFKPKCCVRQGKQTCCHLWENPT